MLFRSIGRVIGFPVETDPEKLSTFISVDANYKYVKYIDNHWLDEVILAGCQPDRTQRIK